MGCDYVYICDWKMEPMNVKCLYKSVLEGLYSVIDNISGVTYILNYLIGTKRVAGGYNYLLLGSKLISVDPIATTPVLITIFRSEDYVYSLVSITNLPCEEQD